LKKGNSANLQDYISNRNGNKPSPVFKNVTGNKKDGMTCKDEIRRKGNSLVSD
jgi:hypothetical protein